VGAREAAILRIPPVRRPDNSTLLSLLLVLALILCPSCGGKKNRPAADPGARAASLAGEWRSEIESAGRIVTGSAYRIEERKDTVSVELVSTKSPAGDELVPDRMWFRARGTWERGALRLAATSWVSGRDTCSFTLRGDLDTEGRLLLHFPADLCGAKSLPYTRILQRPEEAGSE
jgi:hypothetical protein